MNEWNVDSRLPKYEDRYPFEVWIYGDARRVRRIGNRHPVFPPGTLIYTDCTEPNQNILCDEGKIRGWRLVEDEGKHLVNNYHLSQVVA